MKLACTKRDTASARFTGYLHTYFSNQQATSIGAEIDRWSITDFFSP